MVISNVPNAFSSLEVVERIGDHNAIHFTVNFHPQKFKPPKRRVNCYRKADWEGFRGHLRDNLKAYEEKLKEENDIDCCWESFANIFHSGTETYIPHKLVADHADPPWFTREVKNAIKSQRNIRNRYRHTQLEADIAKHKQARKKVKTLIESSFKNFKNNILGEQLKDNPKAFWQYINSCRKGPSMIPVLQPAGGTKTKCDREKAEVLNQQFQGVFTMESLGDVPLFEASITTAMDPITVTEQGVLKQLQKLNPNKSQGPDNVSPRILKELAEDISPYLTLLFKKSLDLGVVPMAWKEANVCPIFKSGKKSDPNNYRPISLTSIIVKILEHIIFSCVMKHLTKNNLLNDAQHGFLPGRSCESQLILLNHELQKSLEDHYHSDLVFLDFSKAFDTVPHQRLLAKVSGYGVHLQALEWIRSFLSNRRQRVAISGEISDWVPVTSGVPQGSVLGPLLFLLYINDLCDVVQSRIKLYADDTLVFREINSIQDSVALQRDLDAIDEWCKLWQLQLNIKKCCSMQVSRKIKRATPAHVYFLAREPLVKVDSYKYLGLNVTSNMSWTPHIQQMVGKANSRLRFVQRVLRGCPQHVKSVAYFTLARPLVEYCSTVWSPHETGLDHEIEMVQRRAARFVSGRYSWRESVTAMLSDLGWETLQKRRQDQDMKLLIRILKGECKIDIEGLLNKASYISIRNGDHPKKFEEFQCRVDYFYQSFFPRVVRQWNKLSKVDVSKHFPEPLVGVASQATQVSD